MESSGDDQRSGNGAGHFITNEKPNHGAEGSLPGTSAGWEYNMVRWLEKEGYDVVYLPG